MNAQTARKILKKAMGENSNLESIFKRIKFAAENKKCGIIINKNEISAQIYENLIELGYAIENISNNEYGIYWK